MGYSPWGCKELDTTESLSLQVEYTVKSKPQLLTDSYKESKDFPVAQTVKNMPAMQETRGQSLDSEDPLEKEMATHSTILA